MAFDAKVFISASESTLGASSSTSSGWAASFWSSSSEELELLGVLGLLFLLSSSLAFPSSLSFSLLPSDFHPPPPEEVFLIELPLSLLSSCLLCSLLFSPSL